MPGIVRALIALVVTVVPAGDAWAATRAIRIDFGDDWGSDFPLGSAQCPGSAASDTFVLFREFTFSGFDDPGYPFGTDSYCQRTTPFNPDSPFDTYFSSASFSSGDETGLASLVGTNTDNRVSAIRYSYLGGPRFSEPNGFQWAFYFFPHDVTVVGLYGLTAIEPTDSASYISDPDGNAIWLGGSDGDPDSYFCFRGSSYIGRWYGSPLDSGACSRALQEVFGDGFE